MASGVRVIESSHLASATPTSTGITVVTGDTSVSHVTNVVTQSSILPNSEIIAIEVMAGIQGPPGVDGIIGEDGIDGREVELQNSGTFIQWRYVGEVSWNNIISIASITGADGATGISANEISPFSVGGVIAVQSYSLRVYATRSVTISSVRASIGTAPTGASIKIDVNKNGTTIFTNQANRPEIAVGTFTDTSVPDITSLVAGDYITFDIDQVGSTVAGSDLVIQVVAS